MEQNKNKHSFQGLLWTCIGTGRLLFATESCTNGMKMCLHNTKSNQVILTTPWPGEFINPYLQPFWVSGNIFSQHHGRGTPETPPNITRGVQVPFKKGGIGVSECQCRFFPSGLTLAKKSYCYPALS